jgi:hypothetical protein
VVQLVQQDQVEILVRVELLDRQELQVLQAKTVQQVHQGQSGSSGSSGQSGTSGSAGSAGSSGLTGTAGSSGSAGSAGSSGQSGTSGSSGQSGTSGSAGSSGSNGAAGGNIAYYTFSNNTNTTVALSNGIFRVNSATYSSVTAFSISTLNRFFISTQAWVDSFDDSNNTIKGFIRLFKEDDPNTFMVLGVNGNEALITGNTSRYSVLYYGSNGTFNDGDHIVVSFAESGNRGDIFYSTLTYTGSIPTSHPTVVNLTIATGLAYIPGQSVIVAVDPSATGGIPTYFNADVISYNQTTGAIQISSTSNTGTGTYPTSLWYINLDGAANGLHGSSGTSGSSGLSGTSGISGQDGVDGADGFSGTSGSSGTAGSSGASGISTLGTIVGANNYLGGNIAGTTLTLGEANEIYPGLLNTGSQNIGGNKVFIGQQTLFYGALVLRRSNAMLAPGFGTINSGFSDGRLYWYKDGSNSGSISFDVFHTGSQNYNYYYPAKSGTIALLDDVSGSSQTLQNSYVAYGNASNLVTGSSDFTFSPNGSVGGSLLAQANTVDFGGNYNSNYTMYLRSAATSASFIAFINGGANYGWVGIVGSGSRVIDAGSASIGDLLISPNAGNILFGAGAGGKALLKVDPFGAITAYGLKDNTNNVKYLTITNGLLGTGSLTGSTVTMNPMDAVTGNNKGGDISNNVLTLYAASTGNPGLMTTGSQTIAGIKTWTGTQSVFNGNIFASGTIFLKPALIGTTSTYGSFGADSNNKLYWQKSGSGVGTIFLDYSHTSSFTYLFPAKSGTIALLDDITGGGGLTTSSGWSLTGNSGLANDGTNFLGPTDNKNLYFKSNNTVVGFLGNTDTGSIHLGYQAGAAIARPDTTWNTFVGYQSGRVAVVGSLNATLGAYTLNNNTSGSNNIAIGYSAMNANTVGNANVAIGSTALNNNVSGNFNTAIGYQSLQHNVQSNITAIGYGSLYANTIGANNTAVGYLAGNSVVSGSLNTFIGSQAGYNNASDNNVGIGYSSLFGNTTGTNNIGIGNSTLSANQSGSFNVFIGSSAGASNATVGNVGIGHNTMFQNTIGALNVALGYQALMSNVSGNNNTALGHQALMNSISDNNTGVGRAALINNKGNNNTAVGFQALQSNVSGTDNVAIGYNAGSSNATSNAVFIGSGAGASNTIGVNNTAIGYNALNSNVSGTYNLMIGTVAGQNNKANNNTFLGSTAGVSNTLGNNNTFVGTSAGFGNITGIGNVLVGSNSGPSLGTDNNTALGYNTLSTAGLLASENTVVGSNAASIFKTGSFNTIIGTAAVGNGVTGSFNTYIGYKVAYNNTSSGSNNIAIGYNLVNISGSNTFQVGNASSATYLYGNMTSGQEYFQISGSLRITNVQDLTDNTAAISAGLVVGTVYRTGDTLKIVH